MKNSKKAAISAILLTIGLSSCSLSGVYNPFAASSNGSLSSGTASKTSFAVNETDPFKMGKDYFRNMVTDMGRKAGPVLGNAKMIVVPIVFKDSASTVSSSTAKGQKIKADLNTTFFGTSSSTNYWESVSSFYAKSSYNNLKITGTVTDFITLPNTLSYYQVQEKGTQGATGVTNTILETAYKALFVNGSYSAADYDGDGDGVIDYFWMVYCNDFDSTGSDDLLWAYTYWDDSGNYSKLSNYSWASYSFMNEGTSVGVDAHTFIHETGHQMGLDDYYSYDSSPSRNPLGCSDMMDANIVDHCSFSKYCFGWITPIVGLPDTTYTLKPFESSGDALILANDFNGTCFDEYYIMEYYTPTGLNWLDSDIAYSTNGYKGISTSGLRILHVDQRLGKVNYKTVGNQTGWVWDGNFYDDVEPLQQSKSYYTIVSSNTQEYCLSSESYALVNLVQASGKTNLMKNGGTPRYAVNADLFQPDSANVFGKTIYASAKADEGWTVPYYVTIDSMDTTEMKVTFHAFQTGSETSSSLSSSVSSSVSSS
jgi:M6 family metalloprotease-like protein